MPFHRRQHLLAHSPAPQLKPQPTAEADNFPLGWELRKESWHFHRRFYAIFRRPMQLGEYSHLLWQIRRRRAQHLWEDCWRVTLPGSTAASTASSDHSALATR